MRWSSAYGDTGHDVLETLFYLLIAFVMVRLWLGHWANTRSNARQRDFNAGYQQGHAEAMDYCRQEVLKARKRGGGTRTVEKIVYVEREPERDEGKRVEHLKGALRTVTEQRDTAARTIEELRAKLEAKPKRKSKPKVGTP